MENKPASPVHVIKIVAETLVIATTAGAAIGAEIGGAEGAKIGAIIGLTTGSAFLIYWYTRPTEAYEAYLFGGDGA